MRVVEMDLPKAAGAAKLRFLAPHEMPGREISLRKKDEIFLAHTEEARFYPLKKGEQFLYTNDGGRGRSLYFGGMDESPFLVELEMAAFENLLDGEEAFFDGLKPTWLRNTERETKKRAKRQGDFFAFSSTKDLSTFLRLHMSRGNNATVHIVEKLSLEGTRHQFSGMYLSVFNNARERIGFGGEGTIEAPDHALLKLDGPHIITQALHLVRPKEAD